MNLKNFSRSKPTQEHQINENIRFPFVFVIDSDNEKIGKMSTDEAVKMAKNKGMDLVLIAIKEIKDKEDDEKVVKIPVAKILDYGKFRYDSKKKKKLEKEKQSFTNNREIRISFNINLQDIKIKAKKAKEFLLDGDRVKVALRFRGREITKIEQGKQVLDSFFEEVKFIAKQSKEVNQSGNFLNMHLERDKKKIPKITSSKQLKELLEIEKEMRENQDA
ncbi:Translation initiation factor IF-3 [Mesomycoplasma conjunctivae]|uniref:Translation initiation factor IF-3 n=1 Tax=Mesomycoplasma conjunctivae (strain ATCC 25834 / NCTC 10147 / HRC/581) TaxID=572263 RepID=C5J7C3_MESCH|nr:translation initiation factor IF-3 [Mesomycoplasma conjunctivae]CAT05386.1 Translation initiation factor IF-3 [Mesomycoplasma conjunctivae]VEU66612.1 Translation initiation factor IF-3 [Mesomycoplasma conjunctivae]